MDAFLLRMLLVAAVALLPNVATASDCTTGQRGCAVLPEGARRAESFVQVQRPHKQQVAAVEEEEEEDNDEGQQQQEVPQQETSKVSLEQVQVPAKMPHSQPGFARQVKLAEDFHKKKDGTATMANDCPWMQPHHHHSKMALCEDGQYSWICKADGHGPRKQCPATFRDVQLHCLW